jgi:hypothetical protein
MAYRPGARKAKWIGGVSAALAVALAPTPGLAVTPPSAEAEATAPQSFAATWFLYAEPHQSAPTRGQQLARLLSDHREPVSRTRRFRPAKLRVLYYTAPLRVGESDLIFKLRAPGKKRSIVTLEFLF